MKKQLLISCLGLFVITGFSQTISDFESQAVPVDSALFGSDMSGGFADGNIYLPNSFNPQFGSWSGWAISNKTDTLTPGFTNQYSAITGSGFDQSANYAVFFSQNPTLIELRGEAIGNPVEGFYITNSTYAYTSMRDGDGFTKKFGGVTGDDPDYFLLTIKGYHNGEELTDSIAFYLADYRFEDHSQDYIVKDWRYVDLLSLGPVDSLSFALSSSDVGQYGMNNPAYFCLDHFKTTDGVTATKELVAASHWLHIFPNPASDFIRVRSSLKDEAAFISIFSLDGSLLLREPYLNKEQSIDVRSLPRGSYVMKLETADRVRAVRLVVL